MLFRRQFILRIHYSLIIIQLIFYFLTDKIDSNAFEQAANQFISTSLPQDFIKETIFAAQDSIIEITRRNLIDALNDGTLFLSYYGHGAPDKWSKYKIFTYGDIDSLKMNNLPFIFTAAACDQPFDLPSDSSIVRTLIVQNKRGTVASINSTGLNFLAQGSDFLTNFYNILFSKLGITIGDAMLQTKLILETYGNSLDAIPRRYTLLGDPALKLPGNTITQVVEEQKNIPGFLFSQAELPQSF